MQPYRKAKVQKVERRYLCVFLLRQSLVSSSHTRSHPTVAMDYPTFTMAQQLRNFAARFTPASATCASPNPDNIKKPPSCTLFPKTVPAIDGDDCLRDCDSCTIKYPSKFTVDEEDQLYGKVDAWDTHLLVATGTDDWVRDIADEKGSIMEAIAKGETKPTNGVNLMTHCLYASSTSGSDSTPSTVLLLPSFTYIDNVTPTLVPTLISTYINLSPTNNTPLNSSIPQNPQAPSAPPHGAIISPLKSRPCPHRYLILLCSQRTRDARCGQSAPLLRREFERHLRPLGLYRDIHDERPGGVGIYFISHVGGHRYSANVMVYRRGDDLHDEAAQCIWLARIRPEDCENIVRYTVLQGKVVKPESQLRGGFDRGRGVFSW
ncbi:MAG: hypothetical protein Q9166_006663 [cf. Caloplaca sp. 2 TL-2023]